MMSSGPPPFFGLKLVLGNSLNASLAAGEDGKGASLLDAAGEHEDAFGGGGGDIGMDDDMGF